MNKVVNASELFPHYFSDGDIYHCGNDFFLVQNPRFMPMIRTPVVSNFFAFLIVYRGYINGSIDDLPFQLTDNTALVILAGQSPVLYNFKEDTDCVLYFFPPKIGDLIFVHSAYTVIREVQLQPIIQLDDFAVKVLATTGELLKQTLSNPLTNAMTDVYLMLLSVTFRLVAPKRFSKIQDNTIIEKREEEIMLQFSRCAEKHYREHRGVKFYAEQLCLTPKYLSTCVKKVSGKTAGEWINYYVIRDAKKMLQERNMTVKEVAYQLNFNDQLIFGKYFKRQTGISPAKFKTSYVHPFN